MHAREPEPSPRERRARCHTFITTDPFDEQFFRVRGCRYKYFEQSGECHFVVSDVDLDAWHPAKERFLQAVTGASEQTQSVFRKNG